MAKAKSDEGLSFDFYLDGITLDDLIEFQEGDVKSFKFIRDFLGRFVADGNGGVLPHEEGIKMVGATGLIGIGALVDNFTEKVNRLSDLAVNPTSADSSNEESEEKPE